MSQTSDNDNLSVNILDRNYNIRCPKDQASALNESAKYLDNQMRKMRSSNQVMSTDRVAVVTALNVAHELLTYRSHHSENEINERITHMRETIAKVLDKPCAVEL